MRPNLRTFFGHFDAWATHNSNRRVELGVFRDMGELPDPTWEGIVEHGLRDADDLLDEAARLRDTFNAIEDEEDDVLDLDLATLWIEQGREEAIRTLEGREKDPQELTARPVATEDIGSPLLRLMLCDPRRIEDRLEDLHTRILQVGQYLQETMRSRLHPPLVERWVRIEREGIADLPTLFASISVMAEEAGWAGTDDLRRAVNNANEALDGYSEWLGQQPTTPRFDIGEEQAMEVIRTRGITLSPADLYTMARDFFTENRRHIEELRQRLVGRLGLPADARAINVSTAITQKHRLVTDSMSHEAQAQHVLAFFKQQTPALLRFINERQLFPVPDGQEMRVIATPGYLTSTIPAGAMEPCAPFAPGPKVSIIMQTLSPKRLGRIDALSNMMLMLHEGIPGHHLQFTSAALHPSKVRRLTKWNDLAEGWTTYLERFMLDVGFGQEFEDEMRLITAFGMARLGARVVIDLYFMTGNPEYLQVGVPFDNSPTDPFELAGSLLAEATGWGYLDPENPGWRNTRVQGELNWYSMQRGYPLSYLTGNVLMRKLREEFRKGTLTDIGRSDRAFHDAVLSAGNMPMSFLFRHFRSRNLIA